jgi:hypothetical protein
VGKPAGGRLLLLPKNAKSDILLGGKLTWLIYWMQNLPGANNGLTYCGRPLTNWWAFTGDFDNVMAGWPGLVE